MTVTLLFCRCNELKSLEITPLLSLQLYKMFRHTEQPAINY